MKKLFRTALASIILGAGLVSIGPGTPAAHAADGACSNNGTAKQAVVGNFYIYKFEVGSTKTSNATCTFTVPTGITSVRFLSVSGGGGGGWDGGGGGGAGGVNKYDNYSVIPGATINITVGHAGCPSTFCFCRTCSSSGLGR